MTLKGKNTSQGFVEVQELSGGWYGLFINGVLKEQSVDLSFILREYDRY